MRKYIATLGHCEMLLQTPPRKHNEEPCFGPHPLFKVVFGNTLPQCFDAPSGPWRHVRWIIPVLIDGSLTSERLVHFRRFTSHWEIAGMASGALEVSCLQC